MKHLRPGKLLRPVRRWIAGKPPFDPDWLEGLEITQEDIDCELLHRDRVSPLEAPRPVSVTWLNEGARA